MALPGRSKAALGIVTVVLVGMAVYMNRQLTPTVAWETDVAGAMSAAQEADRPVLLAFTGPNCPFCWKMERSVLPSEPVERELANYIPVRVDTDADFESTARYGIEGIPAFVIVSPEGEVLDRVTGYQNVDEFISFLQRAVQRSL